MGKFKTGILTLLGVLAMAASAQPAPPPYWTGDRKAEDVASPARNVYVSTSTATGTFGTPSAQHDYKLKLIQDDGFVSFQTVGTTLPYFVAPSQLYYPNFAPGSGVCPPKTSAGAEIDISESTWAWSVVPASGILTDPLTPGEQAVKNGLHPSATAKTKNAVELNLGGIAATIVTNVIGQTYTISVKESIKDKCDAASWSNIDTRFGVTITGEPLVGINATDVADLNTALSTLAPSTSVPASVFVDYEHTINLEASIPALNGIHASSFHLKGKKVLMVTSCNADAIEKFATSIPIKLLSYEKGIGTNTDLKKYAFRAAKLTCVIDEALNAVDYQNASFIDLYSTTANTSAVDKKNYVTFDEKAADYGYKEGESWTLRAGDLKSINTATVSPGKVAIAVDNIFLLVSPMHVKDNTSGVVSVTSWRSNVPYNMSSPVAPNEYPKGYYGAADAGSMKIAYALVIRNIPAPRTGPIYYVPNSLYAQ